MNLKIPNSQQLKRRRITLLMILLSTMAIFMFFVWQVREAFNPATAYEDLTKNKNLVIIDEWHASFFKCSGKEYSEACEAIDDPSYRIKLPDNYGVQKLLPRLSKPPTHVVLRYHISRQDRVRLDSLNQTMLYLPRMVHRMTSLLNDENLRWQTAPGHNLSFFLSKLTLGVLDDIGLVVYIEKLPWFGPADLPIALGSPVDIFEYSRLADKNLLTGNVGRALEFSTRLLVTAMALMLDHSKAFVFLGAYALGRSLRDFVPFYGESGFRVNVLFEEAIFTPINNGLTVFFLLMFLTNIISLKLKFKTQIALLIFCLSEMYAVRFFFPENFVLTADLFADGSADFIGLGLIVWALFKNGRSSLAKNSPNQATQSKQLGSSQFAYKSILLLITLALTFHLYCSISDYFALNTGYFKDFLDWRQFVLFYTLIIAGLIEVGSTSKNMVFYADKMVAQVNMERDLEMGRQVQSEMLPIRRKKSPLWAWRTFYFPASHLAGDWFDVREINFKDGSDVLVACLADVTGHGVAAAMMTSTISSHWGLWCASLEEQVRPQSNEKMREVLQDAVSRIHRGLSAMRSNRGATAAIVILDRKANQLHYATPGHPGIILERAGRMNYLSAAGPRLGGSELQVLIKTETIESGDLVHLFTDGLLPPKEVLSKWLSAIKRSMAHSQTGFARLALNTMRLNRRQFRRDRSIEDDMTLLSLTAQEHLQDKGSRVS